MARKLPPEKRLELESLHRTSRVIAEFMDSLTPALPDGGFVGAVDAALQRGDLRGMRMVYNTLLAISEAASPKQLLELDAPLKQRAGVTVASLLERRFQRVTRILARGKLTSEEQYYLVREYVEFAEHDPSKEEEVRVLWAMLYAFEERALKRPTGGDASAV